MRLPLLTEVFRFVLREAPGGKVDVYGPAKDRYDRFSKSFPEFKRELERSAEKYLGKDWKEFIEKRNGKPGDVDKAIKKLWDHNFTDSEAAGEVGFWYDSAQNPSAGYSPGGAGYGSPLNSSAMDPKRDWNRTTGTVDPRPGRPTGVDAQGDIIYGGGGHSTNTDVPDLE